MGSLTAAALLSKEGKKVLVFERHYVAGGFTHVFKRKGYEWDVGIHYIGEVQNLNSPIRKMFDYVSDGNLKWEDMGEVYDRVIIGDKKYDFVKGVENFKKKLISYFFVSYVICSNVHLLSGVDGLLLNLSFPGMSKVPLSSLSVVSGLKQKNSCIIAANLI